MGVLVALGLRRFRPLAPEFGKEKGSDLHILIANCGSYSRLGLSCRLGKPFPGIPFLQADGGVSGGCRGFSRAAMILTVRVVSERS